jgi:glycosyltransferase involved in cell wall biosynthesis
MNILFLSRWFPYPMNNGSKLRIYNLLRGLRQDHDVTLLSFADQPGVNPEAPEIQGVCSEINVIPWKEFSPNTLRARLAMLSYKPRSIVDTFSSEMAQAITETLDEQQFDLVIASQLQMAAYHPYFQGVTAIFEEFEIGFFHDQAFSSNGTIRLRQALTWFKLRMYLSQLLDSFQACTAASAQERQLLLNNFSRYTNPIEMIPNCLNLSEYTTIKVEKKTNSLIFTGPFKYRANYEAMVWFTDKVFPLILEWVPEAQLIITGDHADLPLPSSKNITLTGFVDDIKTQIASSAVSIAPLMSGGGTRFKILEAMALGTPVVATTKGAEGLDVVNGEHILLANSPAEYAECVIRLLNNEKLRLQITEKARILVQEKYDWSRAWSDYSKLIHTIAQ